MNPMCKILPYDRFNSGQSQPTPPPTIFTEALDEVPMPMPDPSMMYMDPTNRAIGGCVYDDPNMMFNPMDPAAYMYRQDMMAPYGGVASSYAPAFDNDLPYYDNIPMYGYDNSHHYSHFPPNSITPDGFKSRHHNMFRAGGNPPMKHSNSRSGYRVFVRVDSRISNSTMPAKESVFSYFSSFGRVVDCYLPDSATNVAYVCFEDREIMDKVLEIHSHELDNVTVVVTRASPRPDYNINTDRLFVKNVPDGATRNDIRNYFEKFGAVSDVYIPRDKLTGQNKRYAFVTFKDLAVARKLLSSPESNHYIFENDSDPQNAVQVMPAESRTGGDSRENTDVESTGNTTDNEEACNNSHEESASEDGTRTSLECLPTEKTPNKSKLNWADSSEGVFLDEDFVLDGPSKSVPTPPRMKPKQPTTYSHLLTDLDHLLMDE